LAITPITECVEDLPNGELLAHFSYRSNEAKIVEVTVGPENYVQPGTIDRGQPKLFSPGYGKNVFATVMVASQGGSWVLGGAQALVTNASPRCDAREISCRSEEIKDILTRLDALSRAQAQVVKAAASEVAKSPSSRRSIKLAQQYAAEAHDLYLQQWTLIWNGFSSSVLICTQGCITTSDEGTIQTLRSGGNQSLTYARKALALVATKRSARARREVARLNKEAVDKRRAFEVKTLELPPAHSVCEVQ
jgi:hypothetical protein